MDSCFMFCLVSRKMGQSFVRWLVSRPWYMQYEGFMVYEPQPQPWP
jgi:hypothetical protein